MPPSFDILDMWHYLMIFYNQRCGQDNLSAHTELIWILDSIGSKIAHFLKIKCGVGGWPTVLPPNKFPYTLVRFNVILEEIMHILSTWIQMLILSPPLETNCPSHWFCVVHISKYPFLLSILCWTYLKPTMSQNEFWILLAQIVHIHEKFKKHPLSPMNFS